MGYQKGPGRGGVWDSGFKFQTGTGFRIQISNRAGFRSQISFSQYRDLIMVDSTMKRCMGMGFKFQGSFVGFIFQSGWDSGFKFQMGGIQDSNYVFRGPIKNSCTRWGSRKWHYQLNDYVETRYPVSVPDYDVTSWTPNECRNFW